MAIECVVLDLDGTFTDLAKEAPSFCAAFPRLVADLVGKDLSAAWGAAESRVRALAPELAWLVDGRAVAPADADPYILSACTAEEILDRLLVLTRDPALRSDVITAIYRRAYHHTGAAFRPDARPVLEALLARGLPVFVVTNAAGEVAAAKLAALSPVGLERLHVRGDARKFVVGPASKPDARFDAVPEERHFPGLTRPVLLRRGRYFDALAAIWAETSARPETTLVCGDIFELDLALPAELGARVHLIAHERTHAYELEAMRALGARGAVTNTLAPLLERLG